MSEGLLQRKVLIRAGDLQQGTGAETPVLPPASGLSCQLVQRRCPWQRELGVGPFSVQILSPCSRAVAALVELGALGCANCLRHP